MAGAILAALAPAQAFAQRVEGSSDIIDVMMADRMLGTEIGAITLATRCRARVHIEDAIRHYDLLERQRLVARFQVTSASPPYFQPDSLAAGLS